MPGALLAHHRQHSARDVHRADEARRQLPFHLLRRELLEVARVEARRVVDEHVDAVEALECRLDGGLCVLAAGDVELGDEQVVRVAERLGDGDGVAAGGHDVVAGGQGRAGELDAHAAAGAGNEPGLCHGLDGRSAHGLEGGAANPPQRPGDTGPATCLS